jgi:hypothetical protein
MGLGICWWSVAWQGIRPSGSIYRRKWPGRLGGDFSAPASSLA